MKNVFVLMTVIVSLSCFLLASDRLDAGRGVGVLVMAHGDDPEWNRAVMEAVEPLGVLCPFEIAFGMAQPTSLQKAVERLERRGVGRIAVVRVFVSPESFLHQTQYLLRVRSDPPPLFLYHHHGMQKFEGTHSSHSESVDSNASQGEWVEVSRKPAPPLSVKAEVVFNREGLYDSALMGQIIAERVENLSRRAAEESVLILAHGEDDDGRNQRWLSKLEALVEAVPGLGRYRTVRVETLREDWEEKRVAAEERIRAFVERESKHSRVLVVPFRVFGFGPYADVLDGLEHVASREGLLPHPNVTRWIKEQASDCFARAGWPNPFSSRARATRP